MSRAVFFIALALLATKAADTQASSKAEGATMNRAQPSWGTNLIERKLSNGLRVVILPQPSATTVAIHTWFDSGSALDPPNATGVAHLLEHLMFKSTKTRHSGQFDSFLESHGSHANAATWLDWTVFHQVVLPQQVTEVLRFEADRMQGLAWRPDEFDTELEVVRNERREQVEDQPDGRSSELLYALAYGKDSYGHPTIGHAADLKSMRQSALRDHYRRHYGPNRAVVVMVGAISQGIMETIEALYGEMKSSPPAPERGATKLPALGGRRVKVTTKGQSDRLHMGWRSVAVTHADHPELTVLAEVLANAESARLTEALTRTRKLASVVSLHQTMTQRTGLFELQIDALPGVSAESVADVVERMIDDLLKQQAVTDVEVKAAQRRLLARRYNTLASADGCAELLGMFSIIAGSAHGAQRWISAIETVTAVDVQR
nr:hypothetical protein [Myxococcales bacterium]